MSAAVRGPTVSLAVLLAIATSGSAVTAPDDGARARELLAAAGAALKDASTLRGTCEQAYSGTDRRHRIRFAFKRPNLWRFDVTGPGGEAHDHIFDGQSAWTHMKPQKVYVKMGDPKTSPGAVDTFAGALGLLFFDPGGATVVERATGLAVRKDQVEGAACDVVTVERRDVRVETEIWIDAGKRVRRLVILGKARDSGAEAYSKTMEYGPIELSPELSADLFRFTPPAGVQEWKPDAGRPLLPVGSTAPDFEATGPDGRVARLMDFQGKPVVLVFRDAASGPAPPELQKLAAEWRDRGTAVIALDRTEDPPAIQPKAPVHALREKAGEVSRAFWVTDYPTTYVIGPDRRIEMAHNGFRPDWIRQGLETLKAVPPAAVGEGLEAVLSAMQMRVAAVKDLRASVLFTSTDKDPRAQALRAKPVREGTLAFRAPGEAGWRVRPLESDTSFCRWADRGKGLGAALGPDHVLLHIPWRLHVPEDFGGLEGQEHHGVEYYRGEHSTHTPPPFPMLARPPLCHPALFLLEFAPRTILARLPGLTYAGKKEADGRTYHVLSTEPLDPSDGARVDESLRMRDETWFGGEIWVDAEEHWIEQVVFRYENSSAAPRFRREHRFRFGQRGRFDGVNGIPTNILHEGGAVQLSDLRINTGVKDAEVRIDVPASAIVRDWVVQPVARYQKVLEKNPADATAWLNLASVRFRRQEYERAAAAFHKVVEIKPRAPEGYVGLCYLLKLNDTPANMARVRERAAETLEKASGADVPSPIVPLALAHYYSKACKHDAALSHFEEVLKIVGEDAGILESMICTTEFGSRDALMRHYVRTFEAELRAPCLTGAYPRWKNVSPSARERLALTRIYEEAVARGDMRPWIRIRLIDCYPGAGQKDVARKHALAAVEELSRAEAPGDAYVSDQIMEYLLGEKDRETAARLLAIFTGRGPAAERQAALLETDLVVARSDVETLRHYLDERIGPDWTAPEGLRMSWILVRFVSALKRERKTGPFARTLVEHLEDPSRRSFYADVLDYLLRGNHLLDADAAEVRVRMKEKLPGK